VLEILRIMIRRDLLLAMRRRAEVANALLFFVIVASLFPLGIGPESNLLRLIAPGIIWVAALLASLLALGRMFAPDHADGTLEQMLLAREPLVVIVAGKIVAHWLVSGLPLVLLAPVLAIQFDLAADSLLILVVSLLLGTPSLILIGAVGAALTLGVRGSSLLTALLVLPLYVPVLILGTSAADAAAGGVTALAHLLLLAAFLVFAAVFAPLAVAMALRIAFE
jgi:heme exporter protein B